MNLYDCQEICFDGNYLDIYVKFTDDDDNIIDLDEGSYKNISTIYNTQSISDIAQWIEYGYFGFN